MRIIAGTYKSRRLQSVPGKLTRPTSDKIKEAIFNRIGPFFNGGHCLDLFAGSGALGLEALSRGMDRAIFVDRYSKAIQTIHRNIKALQLQDQTEVYRMEAFRALQYLANKRLNFDLILMDPPYLSIDFKKIIALIQELHIVKQHGMVVCEHDVQEQLPKDLGPLTLLKRVNYGKQTAITLYQSK